ncbi:Chromatin-Remodeling Atpase Ino80 [Manis pentadactyla]|nr:Chromatin-Remodeling Atpase Ino80 [Manis pentadactyla]
MNIHTARAARPAPSPAGLRVIYFWCPVSPPPSPPPPLPRRCLRLRLPGYLCLAASRSLAQLSAAPRPHAPGPSSRRAAWGAGAGA